MSSETTVTSSGIGIVRDYILLGVAIVTAVAGIIFWIQNVGDDRVERVEHEIELIRVDIDKIKDNNTEILRIIGRLEGKLDNLR
jgi:tetrahydromethanopterin S-methyltransferase subunit A